MHVCSQFGGEWLNISRYSLRIIYRVSRTSGWTMRLKESVCTTHENRICRRSGPQPIVFCSPHFDFGRLIMLYFIARPRMIAFCQLTGEHWCSAATIRLSTTIRKMCIRQQQVFASLTKALNTSADNEQYLYVYRLNCVRYHDVRRNYGFVCEQWETNNLSFAIFRQYCIVIGRYLIPMASSR